MLSPRGVTVHPGVVTADDVSLLEDIQRRMITLGGCLDPHPAFLVWRGMQTLRIRLIEECRTAAAIAAAMADDQDVERVLYPGGLITPTPAR